MKVSLLLVAALVAPSLSISYLESYKCPVGWNLLETTCFLVSSASGSWYEGIDYCNEQGATLATVTSEAQQTALSAMLTDSAWIGLSDLNNDYAWADGSTYKYTSWQRREHKVCVEMKKSVGFLWHVESCIDVRPFLCSIPAKRITTIVTTATTPAPYCHDWMKYGSSCYYVRETRVSWHDAQTICSSHGGHLAIVTSEGEHNFLKGMLQKRTWIGLHRVDDAFLWVDGSRLGYTKWKSGEPNNMDLFEDCVEMIRSQHYRWNDLNCNDKLGYVCEWTLH